MRPIDRRSRRREAGLGVTSFLLPAALATLLVGGLIGSRFFEFEEPAPFVVAARAEKEAAEERLAKAPGDADALRQQLDALRMLEDHDERLRIVDDQIRQDEERAWLHAYRAVTLLELNRDGEASVACDRAMQLDPDCHFGHAARGFHYECQGLIGKATEAYDRALANEPRYVFALIGRGTCARLSGTPKDGQPYVDEAVMIDPSNPDAHFERGCCLEASGDLHGARLAYERALQLAPGYGAVWDRLDHVEAMILARDTVGNVLDLVKEATR